MLLTEVPSVLSKQLTSILKFVLGHGKKKHVLSFSTHFSTHSEVLFKGSARTLFLIISLDKIYWNPMWGYVDNIGIKFIVMDNICR